ncbi:hypothetical protein GCM10009696_04090 [Kocuria himachalensis]
MRRSPLSRTPGLAVAALLAAGPGTPVRAVTLQTFFAETQGRRVERHPHLLGRVNDDRLDDVVGSGEFAGHTSLSAVPAPVP